MASLLSACNVKTDVEETQLGCENEKAKAILGWNPQYADLHTIVSSAWAWHKNHPNGYQG